jgi:hypothetical protein
MGAMRRLAKLKNLESLEYLFSQNSYGTTNDNDTLLVCHEISEAKSHKIIFIYIYMSVYSCIYPYILYWVIIVFWIWKSAQYSIQLDGVYCP